jgi:hypothetical protein
MLDVSPQNLSLESEAAMRATEKDCRPIDEQVKRFLGPFGAEGKDDSDFDPENHAYESIALSIGRKVFGVAEWDVSSRRGPEEQADAEAMSMSLNRWTRDVDLRATARRLYVDFRFKYCVACTYQAPVPGSDPGIETGVAWRPQVRRISPKHFFRDPLAFTADDCRFLGHQTIRDKADLVREAEDNPKLWNINAIRALPEGSDLREMRGSKDPQQPDRKEVVIREIWVPEYTLPDNDPMWLDAPTDPKERRRLYHGTIFKIGIGGYKTADQKSDFIAPPRPFFGPRWGMYSVGEYLPVPDRVTGLSSLSAVEGQVRLLNTVARALRKSMEKRKTVGVVSAKDANAAGALNDAEDGSTVVVQVDDVRTAVASIPLGGTDEQVLTYYGICRDVVERVSGLASVRTGSVTGQATATEHTIAAGAGEARTAGEDQQFDECLTQVGRTAAWYMHNDDRYVAPLGDGSTFYGGPPSSHADAIRKQVAMWGLESEEAMALVEQLTSDEAYAQRDFDDLEFSISPMSMEHPSEIGNQQKAAALSPLIFSAFQLSAVAPAFQLGPYLAWMAKAFRAPEVGRLANGQVLMATQMLALQGMATAAQGEAGGTQTQSPASPRMAKDVTPSARVGPSPQSAYAGAKKQGLPGNSSGGKAQSTALTQAA